MLSLVAIDCTVTHYVSSLILRGQQLTGGVSVGRQKLRQQKVLNSSPLEMQFSGGGTVPSRAAAAAGQSGLMALYDSLFGMMDLQAAQVLVTRNDFTGMHVILRTAYALVIRCP